MRQPALWGIGALLLACRSAAPVPMAAQGPDACPAEPFARDWSASPAVVRVDGFRGTLYAVGDVHGMVAELRESLERAGVIAAGEPLRWLAGDSLLVQAGDLVNKGPGSLEAVELAQAISAAAREAGGRAIFIAGNHEVGFLAKARQVHYRAIAEDAARRGLGVCEVASPRSPFGRWLRERPVAVLVNGVYISHSGNSQGRTLDGVASLWREVIDRQDFSNRQACGDASTDPPTPGLMNADAWWGAEGQMVTPFLAALGARQMLFANDEKAFGATGAIAGSFADGTGRALVKLDVGTVYGESRGAVYRCREWLPSAGCARHQRLANPPAGTPPGPGSWEEVPVSERPPPREAPVVKPWGC